MKTFALFAAALASTPLAAEVVNASSDGFEVRQTVALPLKPEVAFAKFADVGAWWNPQHTYSGTAENMALHMSVQPTNSRPGSLATHSNANSAGTASRCSFRSGQIASTMITTSPTIGSQLAESRSMPPNMIPNMI